MSEQEPKLIYEVSPKKFIVVEGYRVDKTGEITHTFNQINNLFLGINLRENPSGIRIVFEIDADSLNEIRMLNERGHRVVNHHINKFAKVTKSDYFAYKEAELLHSEDNRKRYLFATIPRIFSYEVNY